MNTAPESTVFRSLALADTGVVVSSTPARIFGWTITNTAAAIRYVKIYNRSTAANSTHTPVFTIGVPALSTVEFYPSGGVNCSLGISARCTTGAPDNDATGASPGDVICQILFKSP
jgi:hypothetical protein